MSKKPQRNQRYIVQIVSNIYSYNGAFALLNKSTRRLTFYYCREEFGNHFRLGVHKSFFYGMGKSLKFSQNKLDWLENVLNLKKEYRTTIHQCVGKDGKVIKGLMNFQLSPFWLASKTRFNFLTIFVRAIQRGKGETNNLNLLISESYFKETPIATFLFLNGFTLPNSKTIRGWVNSYKLPLIYYDKQIHVSEKQTQIYIDRSKNRLRKPSEKDELVYFRYGNCNTRLTESEKEQLVDFCFSKMNVRTKCEGKVKETLIA